MKRRRVLGLVVVMLAGVLLASSAWGAAGDPLWEQSFDFLADGYNQILVWAMVASPTTLYLAGQARHYDNSQGAIGFLKAFDAATGTPKWDKILTTGASYNNLYALTLDGNLLLVRGAATTYSTSYPPVYSLYKTYLRCYQAESGQQLWEVTTDFNSNPINGFNGPLQLLVANNLVYNLFAPVNTASVPDGTCLVRAYQERNVVVQNSLLLE